MSPVSWESYWHQWDGTASVPDYWGPPLTREEADFFTSIGIEPQPTLELFESTKEMVEYVEGILQGETSAIGEISVSMV
jgi:hypothetical protein